MQLHEELKKIRTRKNISLKQVSNETKIRIDFLQRIEEGDYSFAPLPFVRAFLRAYAEVVGVDPFRAMEKLDKKIQTILPESSESQGNTIAEPPATLVTPVTPVTPETTEQTTAAVPRKSRRKKEPGTLSQEPQPSLPGISVPAPEIRTSAPAAGTRGQESSAEPLKEMEIHYSETRKEMPKPAPVAEERNPIPERTVRVPEQAGVTEAEEEEEHSVRNIIFAVVVIMGLIAAIILIYLNRYTIF